MTNGIPLCIREKKVRQEGTTNGWAIIPPAPPPLLPSAIPIFKYLFSRQHYSKNYVSHQSEKYAATRCYLLIACTRHNRAIHLAEKKKCVFQSRHRSRSIPTTQRRKVNNLLAHPQKKKKNVPFFLHIQHRL